MNATQNDTREGNVSQKMVDILSSALQEAGIQYRTDRHDYVPSGEDRVATDYSVSATAKHAATGNFASVQILTLDDVASASRKLKSKISERATRTRKLVAAAKELDRS